MTPLDNESRVSSPGRGVFVAVDGCSGVGKTALVAELVAQLNPTREVRSVKLPSSEPLGQMARRLLEKGAPDAVALTAAADRALIAESVILPTLRKGKAVVVDRYVLSALALNSLSGIPQEFSYGLCSRLPRPDISVHLRADPKIIQARLRKRSQLDYYERAEINEASSESASLDAGMEFLRERNWNIVHLDVTSQTPSQAAEQVCGLLSPLLGSVGS